MKCSFVKIVAGYLILASLITSGALAAPTVDLSGYNPNCGIIITPINNRLQVTWMADGQALGAGFSLSGEGPLISFLGVGNNKILAQGINPVFLITTGARLQKPGVPYIYFDRPIDAKNGPVNEFTAQFTLERVRVTSNGARAEIHFSKLAAGPFTGELVVHVYAGSPLLHLEAALLNAEAKNLAYSYDSVLDGPFRVFVWKDTQDKIVRSNLVSVSRPIAVRNRTIMSEGGNGTLAVFPPPHAYLFPRDYTENWGYVQAGKGRFGLHQDLGSRDSVPWADAPVGKVQHMGMFLLLSAAKAEPTLERVKRYTHGDAFKPLEGYITMTSHFHPMLTISDPLVPQTSYTQKYQRDYGKLVAPRMPIFKKVMTAMGVNVFHEAEYHREGHRLTDTGKVRLDELKAMYDVGQKYSDANFLVMPGEEANAFIPGHWLYAFPKPVYMTLKTMPGAPFSETVAPYGKVYHPQNEEDMGKVLTLEHGLGWTAHPRIKSSEGFPDGYKDKDWYKGDAWLGGAWKALPADLSTPRLGVRALDLLDDMNLWGQRKMVLGEVDTFDLLESYEQYGHMNINYLHLPKVPSYGDYSAIFDVLRKGDFFVSTGEVLIRSCQAADGKIQAELDWTFPLAEVVLVTCDGKAARQQTVELPQTTEQGRQRFEWPADGLKDAQWFRLEVWDVAGNGAFTQPIYLKK